MNNAVFQAMIAVVGLENAKKIVQHYYSVGHFSEPREELEWNAYFNDFIKKQQSKAALHGGKNGTIRWR